MNQSRTHRYLILLILAGFTILATIYSLVTPIFEASDELWHYPMVRYVAEHNFGLPVQRAGLSDTDAPWRQEGSQPPLYYMLGAALTFWINTDDMPQVRRLNPHADIGVIVPDGNANMVLHDSEAESFPWSVTVLAVHLVRLLSILMGLGTVYVTYLLGRELFPAKPRIALGGAAFVAFNPMFLFISASVNNDNLATLMASVLLLQIVRLLKYDDNRSRPLNSPLQPHWSRGLDRAPDSPSPVAMERGPGGEAVEKYAPIPLTQYVSIGLAAGIGMLAKFQIGFMLVLVALALLIVAIRRRDWRIVVVGGAISGAITILIAGWWYWRNYDLYGDFTGINIFLDIVGRRAVPADLSQLWTERETFMMAFWGLFGGVNVPMWDWVYIVFNVMAGFAIAGLAYSAYRAIRAWRTPSPAQAKVDDSPADTEEDSNVFVYAPVDSGQPASPLSSSDRERGRGGEAVQGLQIARVFAAIWPVIVFISLITWTRQTPASQGRLMFSAIAPLMIGMAAGLVAWSSRFPRSRAINFGMAAFVFVAVAIIVPFAIIRPAYTFDPDATWDEDTLETDEQIAACFLEPEAGDQDALCIAAQRLAGTILPGEYLLFDPVIRVANVPSRNWSIFVHLVNEDGIIEAQRDVYPGGGLVATAETDPGETWSNLVAVKLPLGLYTPQTLDVYMGFYDYPTNERMIPRGENADLANNRVYLGQIRLDTPEGDIPNPVDVNFDGKMTLLGYTITDRSLAPGESTAITLFWSARQAALDAYAISLQIIDPETLTKAAQSDANPDPPTETWTPGEAMTDTRALAIDLDAAPGRYRLLVRVYPYVDGVAGAPLRIRTDAGGQSEDFVWLSWIQVE